jgi:hypothetical protein
LWAGFPVLHNARSWEHYGYYRPAKLRALEAGGALLTKVKGHSDRLEVYKQHTLRDSSFGDILLIRRADVQRGGGETLRIKSGIATGKKKKNLWIYNSMPPKKAEIEKVQLATLRLDPGTRKSILEVFNTRRK